MNEIDVPAIPGRGRVVLETLSVNDLWNVRLRDERWVADFLDYLSERGAADSYLLGEQPIGSRGIIRQNGSRQNPVGIVSFFEAPALGELSGMFEGFADANSTEMQDIRDGLREGGRDPGYESVASRLAPDQHTPLNRGFVVLSPDDKSHPYSGYLPPASKYRVKRLTRWWNGANSEIALTLYDTQIRRPMLDRMLIG